jgi:hypothetical protein
MLAEKRSDEAIQGLESVYLDCFPRIKSGVAMTPVSGCCGSRLVWTLLLHVAKSVHTRLDPQKPAAGGHMARGQCRTRTRGWQ